MGGRQWDGDESAGGTLAVEREADGAVLYLRGDVDAPVVDQARKERQVDGEDFVAVDVGELSYIDSTALTLLVRWAQRAAAAGRPAVIRRAGPRFHRVLEVAGLTAVFTCVD